MKYWLHALIGAFYWFAFMANHAISYIQSPNLPDQGVLAPENNSFIDPREDYSIALGRVTDRDKTRRVLKVYFENHNVRFLQSGDKIQFKVYGKKSNRLCRSYVRTVELDYVIMEVEDFTPCWNTKQYFRRGTILQFFSPKIQQRVYEASKMREILLLKKDQFLKQLNEVNNFLHFFELEKVKKTAEYDRKIEAMKTEKIQALKDLFKEKKEKARLQAQLKLDLTDIDQSLKFYRIDRTEILKDRFQLDHDLGHAMQRNRQRLRAKTHDNK
jgi:hypothetical protein